VVVTNNANDAPVRARIHGRNVYELGTEPNFSNFGKQAFFGDQRFNARTKKCRGGPRKQKFFEEGRGE
jgi:hypothetical protein